MTGVNLESMSDEDFLNSQDEIFSEPDPIEEDEGSLEDTVDETDGSSDDENSQDEDEHDEDFDDDEADDDQDTDDDDHSSDDDDESEDNGDEDEDQADDDTDTRDGEDDTDDATDTDFEAGYKELFAPIQANGKEVTLDNVEDARKLIQMGLGYHKSMLDMKPNKKIIKALEKNDLLDPDKINYLIDLSNKDPKAIAKLVAESGVDPLDINTKDGEDYEPTNHEISDKDFNLEEAIDNIKDSESYDKSIAVMGREWDQESRDIIKENPVIVGVVNDHIQSGVFDVVQSYVETEQALGRMDGMSNVEAYRNGVDALQKSGVLSKTGQLQKNGDDKGQNKDPLAKEAKRKQEAKRKIRRKAAAPSKNKSKGKKTAVDYSDMSDEEFLATVG